MLWLFFSCVSDEPAKPTIRFETGDVAVCTTTKDPNACYRAALDNPDSERLDLMLSPACRAQVEDSCRRYFQHAIKTGKVEEAGFAMMMGCEAGDDHLCQKYLEKAETTADPAQRAWMIEHVRTSRAQHAAPPTQPPAPESR